MATRSLIGVLRPGNQVEFIYCHFDGYEEGVGKTLCEEFFMMDAINNLIALGDVSTIHDNIVAYHRDRGEDWEDVKPKMVALEAYPSESRHFGTDFEYLYRNGKWEVYRDREWTVMEWNNGINTAGSNTIRQMDL